MTALGLILLSALVATGAGTPPEVSEQKQSFGAAVGPAVLPAGATAAYAYVGLPELGAGFRQGLSLGEWEVRGRVDYLALTAAGELSGKVAFRPLPRLEVGPHLGVGIAISSGVRFFDPYAFSYVGLRLLGGASVSYRATETVMLLGRVEVPYDQPLATGGGGHLRALGGGGVEVYLADDLSAVALAEAGLDYLKQPLGVPVARFFYQLALGIGLRLF